MTNSGIYNLFVYGSLRSGFQSPVYEYISRYFTLIGDARVKGILVDMGEYPAGIPTTDEHFIIGELYRIKNESEFSWAIGQLDDYEGIHVESGEEQHYRRDVTTVYINNEQVPALIYWFNGDVTNRPVIHSGDLLQYLNDKK